MIGLSERCGKLSEAWPAHVSLSNVTELRAWRPPVCIIQTMGDVWGCSETSASLAGLRRSWTDVRFPSSTDCCQKKHARDGQWRPLEPHTSAKAVRNLLGKCSSSLPGGKGKLRTTFREFASLFLSSISIRKYELNLASLVSLPQRACMDMST